MPPEACMRLAGTCTAFCMGQAPLPHKLALSTVSLLSWLLTTSCKARFLLQHRHATAVTSYCMLSLSQHPSTLCALSLTWLACFAQHLSVLAVQDGQSEDDARRCPVCQQGTLQLAAFRDFQGFRCTVCPHDHPVASPKQASMPPALAEHMGSLALSSLDTGEILGLSRGRCCLRCWHLCGLSGVTAPGSRCCLGAGMISCL